MILTVAISLLAVAGFGIGLWKTNVAGVSWRASETMMEGLSAMMDGELGDDAKEIAVRRAGFALVGASFAIAWRFALALALAALPIVLADAAGIVPAEAVMGLMLRLDYILVVSVLAIVLAKIAQRSARKSPAPDDEAQGYASGDKLIHTLAFAGPGIQKAVSRLDDRLTSRRTVAPSAPPIFVTSIARGGTTALLNALSDMPGVATHTYRDMPFVTAPALWHRLSGGKKRQVARKRRAHGDGLEIDLDSPEAFEEVLWKMFWPEKYRGQGIETWSPEDRKPEADRFIERHMAKIVTVRRDGEEDPQGQAVYCSKNNANIARIRYLTQSFPGCRIVVPVRRPESHAASLLRQHDNFLRQQAEDPFVRRYMRDIGHHEFGQIHKPLMFPGFDPGARDTASPDYWLDYWIHAFRHVREQSELCRLVLQDDLRAKPAETLGDLCRMLHVEAGKMDFTTYFRSSPDRTDTGVYDPALLTEAKTLYDDLVGIAHTQAGRAASPQPA